MKKSLPKYDERIHIYGYGDGYLAGSPHPKCARIVINPFDALFAEFFPLLVPTYFFVSCLFLHIFNFSSLQKEEEKKKKTPIRRESMTSTFNLTHYRTPTGGNELLFTKITTTLLL